MAPKVSFKRDDDRGMIELGLEDGDHFVAFTSMPTSQYDGTIENLKAAADANGSSEK